NINPGRTRRVRFMIPAFSSEVTGTYEPRGFVLNNVVASDQLARLADFLDPIDVLVVGIRAENFARYAVQHPRIATLVDVHDQFAHASLHDAIHQDGLPV